MTSDYTEDSLVEQPTIALFERLGWETANGYSESAAGCPVTGRDALNDVVLVDRLRRAIDRLNPDLDVETRELASLQAVQQLTRDRSAMTKVQANCEVYDLLKDGVRVTYRAKDNTERIERVKIIDWNEPDNNDFFLVSQLWVAGEMYTRRTDLVGFVNGLPLVLFELKSAKKNVKDAYDDNLRDYKDTIPQLFWYNAFIILSNGSDSRIGTLTSDWEHFAEWKRINSEGEEGVVSLETMIRGTCAPDRLLDMVENFILFSEEKGGLQKLVAYNHQYLGVNNAIEAVQRIEENQGRLGVFWHTQGSGKSYAMLFFAQKILRNLHGNWTFVIVTDRLDLDEQIYKTFARAGVLTESETQVRAQSVADLKDKLQEDHRYLFTLIQKFQTEPGETYPTLSERSDIIVISDEAHRSQYDVLAANMRSALPNAAFIGFTGTPLMAGEEKTREVFGDYVSIYNFKQSVQDGATVPLYYENRIPELELTNEAFNEQMERLLAEAAVDEEQERVLEQEFAREYHLITRESRLEAIAEDIVQHFLGRGHMGKAMVISIDRLTAVRMYEKVKHYWQQELNRLRDVVGTRHVASLQNGESPLQDRIRYMETTDMAVVISQSQNEVDDFRQHGLDIVPHRKRIQNEDLDEKFKDPDDPLRIVFVCAMWTTGFDAPACSTIYLDKPMRNHTLMQTIARANRVFGEKNNGLIVDYVGIFRNLQQALAIYGSDPGGGIKEGEMPVKEKEALVEQLEEAIEEARAFCEEHDVELDAIHETEGFERINLRDDAAEAIMVNDDHKQRFLSLANYVDRLFRAILPDTAADDYRPEHAALQFVADRIRQFAPEIDISGVQRDVEALLDRSIDAEISAVREQPNDNILRPARTGADDRYLDLSKIDFEALQQRFEQTNRKRTEAEKLRGAITRSITRMVRLNRTRVDYMERLRELIDDYNAGAADVEEYYHRLMALAKELSEEEQRHVREGLTEEELAIFDLLTRPEIDLTEEEVEEVKAVARELLETLKNEKLVLDWKKRQQTLADVRLTIEKELDRLPATYSATLYRQTCDQVYQHIYETYAGAGKSVYSEVA